MIFVGHDADALRMEIMELRGHPFYAAVQYHPEYLSRPMRPSPPYLGLILAATGKLEAFLAKGCQIHNKQTDESAVSSDDDEDEALANLVKSTFMQGLATSKTASTVTSKQWIKNDDLTTASSSSMDSPRSGDTSPN